MEKFSNLFKHNNRWRVRFNNIEYMARDILHILFGNMKSWECNATSLNKEKYILVVGENSFHYLLFIFLASCFNLKIIITNHKQSSFFDKQNFEDIEYIISTRKITSSNKKLLLMDINLDLKDESFQIDLSKIKDKQAEIVFCTSGTTGDFKMAMYYEHKLYQNAKIVGDYMEISKNENCLCMFHLGYMYGFSVTMSVLIKGGFVILERSTLMPSAIIEYLVKDSITLLPIIGKIVDELIPHVQKDMFFPELKIINASDKIYVSHVEKIFKLAPIFWNNMGQTEAGPRLFSLKILKNDDIERYSYNGVIALGMPVNDGIKIAVKNESGADCQDGEIGELFYKTKFGMENYLNFKNDSDDKWRSSGDIVCKKDNGIVYWIGRKSQLIKCNGVFINPNLLHVFFEKLPFVASCFFVSDDTSNKIYGFFVIRKKTCTDKDSILTQINKHYINNFPLYPRIDKIIFLSDFPKTESGKIHIQELKELASISST
jgi:acyl-coenzyme A synthetase/AMP-(fatty) acid ligase